MCVYVFVCMCVCVVVCVSNIWYEERVCIGKRSGMNSMFSECVYEKIEGCNV